MPTRDGVAAAPRLLTELEVLDAFAGAWDGEGAPPLWIDRMNAVQRKLLEINGLAAPDAGAGAAAAPEPVAIAEVIEGTADDLEARIRWLFNPMPVGSFLYESREAAAPLWFLRVRRPIGWGAWTQCDAATVEDFRKNVTQPVYEVRQFVPVDGVPVGEGARRMGVAHLPDLSVRCTDCCDLGCAACRPAHGVAAAPEGQGEKHG